MKNHGIEGLEQDDSPALYLNQTVNVIAGRYKGKIGKAHRLYEIASQLQLELVVDNEHIFVYPDEIDFKFECAEIVLFMNDDDRAEHLELVKNNEQQY